MTTALPRDRFGRFISVKHFQQSEFYQFLVSEQAFKTSKFRELQNLICLFQTRVCTDDDFQVLLQYCNDTNQVLFWTSQNTIRSLYEDSQVLTESMLKLLFFDMQQLTQLSQSKVYKRDLYTNLFLNKLALMKRWCSFEDLLERFKKLGVFSQFVRFSVKHAECFFKDDYQTLDVFTDLDLKTFQKVVAQHHDVELIEILILEPKFCEFLAKTQLLDTKRAIESLHKSSQRDRFGRKFLRICESCYAISSEVLNNEAQ